MKQTVFFIACLALVAYAGHLENIFEDVILAYRITFLDPRYIIYKNNVDNHRALIKIRCLSRYID